MTVKKDELARIVGPENVSDAREVLESFSRDESFALPIRPACAARPDNAAEVQKIVQWAKETRTPLVPVSSGPPRFRGDSVPSAAGAVIVDLRRMNRVLRIDRRNRMTVIEPGVTYAQLQPQLAAAGLRLSTPLLPRANKSVVASLLEREPVLVPRFQWAMLDPLRCLEVVWGDGVLFTTGDASRPGALEQEWADHMAQVGPEGPAQTDYHKLVSAAQGSMGIVTWASVKCEVGPQIHKLFFASDRDLSKTIELAYKLLRLRFGDELLLLNGAALAAMLERTPEGIAQLRRELPPWTLLVGIAGRSVLPHERVEFQERDIRDLAQECGLVLAPSLCGLSSALVLETILNPSAEPYWKFRARGANRDVFFLSTLERGPEFAAAVMAAAEEHGWPSSEIGVYFQPVHQGAGCHMEFNLPFNGDDPGETARMKDFLPALSQRLSGMGAYFSRPYGSWADLAYNRDAQTTAVLKKVKDLFDPCHVMNPGKLCF